MSDVQRAAHRELERAERIVRQAQIELDQAEVTLAEAMARRDAQLSKVKKLDR